mmetsp:Transcript_20913/g.67375  ORF Transcript_20913/g.67375 Transcript_20913/m.67375 type:complete len:212 (-) Transcript_20913:64-699(-)
MAPRPGRLRVGGGGQLFAAERDRVFAGRDAALRDRHRLRRRRRDERPVEAAVRLRLRRRSRDDDEAQRGNEAAPREPQAPLRRRPGRPGRHQGRRQGLHLHGLRRRRPRRRPQDGLPPRQDPHQGQRRRRREPLLRPRPQVRTHPLHPRRSGHRRRPLPRSRLPRGRLRRGKGGKGKRMTATTLPAAAPCLMILLCNGVHPDCSQRDSRPC